MCIRDRIIGFAKAAQTAMANKPVRTQYEMRMRDYMIHRVLTEIPFSRLNGDSRKRLPGNMNFSFQFVDGGTLIVMLDKQGICAVSYTHLDVYKRQGLKIRGFRLLNIKWLQKTRF